MNRFHCIIAIVCICVCFLSMHFKITLWVLDFYIGDVLNDQICPRILLTGWISFRNSSFYNLWDVGCGMQKRPSINYVPHRFSFHKSPFCNLRDAASHISISTTVYFACGMHDAGCRIVISIFPRFRKLKLSEPLILVG